MGGLGPAIHDFAETGWKSRGLRAQGGHYEGGAAAAERAMAIVPILVVVTTRYDRPGG
jgi:hypothetical protein